MWTLWAALASISHIYSEHRKLNNDQWREGWAPLALWLLNPWKKNWAFWWSMSSFSVQPLIYPVLRDINQSWCCNHGYDLRLNQCRYWICSSQRNFDFAKPSPVLDPSQKRQQFSTQGVGTQRLWGCICRCCVPRSVFLAPRSTAICHPPLPHMPTDFYIPSRVSCDSHWSTFTHCW